MKTLADLDRTHRTIPSHLIRQMTGDRTGQTPHNYLWCDMRQCAAIQLKQRRLSQLEAIRLIAVTVIWQETGQLPTNLVQVNRVASELLNCWETENMLSTLQERKLSATELREAITRMTGKRPAESTLYFWGQKHGVTYSRRKQYTPSQVNGFIRVAQSSSAVTESSARNF